MPSKHVIPVTEGDFEYEVIAYSRQKLVLVDFWAQWSGPSRAQIPILDKLAEEGDGAFRLARVDVDASPNLALRFGVRSLPHGKAFRAGQVVNEYSGAQPEERLREFVRGLLATPSPNDLRLEKALGLLDQGNPAGAENEFRAYLANAANHPAALLGLGRALVVQSKLDAALSLLEAFPPSKEYTTARSLLDLVKALRWAQTSPFNDEDPLEPIYLNALLLALRGNPAAAMDGLLDVLRQDKHYRSDEARKAMLGLFEMLGSNHPLTRQYRNELALVLF